MTKKIGFDDAYAGQVLEHFENDILQNIDLVFHNTDMYLVISNFDNECLMELDVTEEIADKIISVLQQWKEWRND